MKLLSLKHIAPCGVCHRPSHKCLGHEGSEWRRFYVNLNRAAQRQREQAKIDAEQAAIRGTPQWKAANRAKRKALRPRSGRAL